MNEKMNLSVSTEQGLLINKQQTQRAYSVFESIFAWFCLIAGYIFWRVCPVVDNPLGGFLFILILFCTTAIVLKIKGVKFSILPTVFAVSAIIVSASLIIGANGFISFLAYIYSLATYCYFVYTLTGNSLKSGFSNFIFVDYFKALFVMPFHSFEKLFKALFPDKSKNKGKVFLKLFVGIVIAFIPTVIVLILLSYDSLFSELLSRIFDFDFYNIFSHIMSIGFGIPVGMYIFGLFISSSDKDCREMLSADSCIKTGENIKIVPTVTALSASVPLLIVYVVFFISQWQYYVSGFTGVLPKNFSYAQYAREGFFQLCTVAVINLLVVIFAVAFMKSEKGCSAILKIIVLLYSAFTLVLISTAVAKMVMYINCYGLTQKRVYATWFMIVLAIVFILLVLHQFMPKINTAAISFVVCVVFFAVLSVSNVDGQIAKYNTDRYINGTLETIDIEAMNMLGDSAVPELVRLEKHLSQKETKTEEEILLCDELSETLDCEKEYLEELEKGFFSFSYSSYKAQKCLNER